MWSTIIFAIALFGLVLLFGLKAFELAKGVHTPLIHVRKVGDPIIIHGWTKSRHHSRKIAFSVLHACVLWARSAIQQTESFFHNGLHTIAARLNRYLRAKRVNIGRESEVSAHLKTVLEKEERHSGEAGEEHPK